MKRSTKLGVDLLLLMGLLALIWVVLLILPGGRAGLEKDFGRAAVAPWELVFPPPTVTPEPTPAAARISGFNKPGACYSAHSLPDAVEVAGNILSSAGIPDGTEYRGLVHFAHGDRYGLGVGGRPVTDGEGHGVRAVLVLGRRPKERPGSGIEARSGGQAGGRWQWRWSDGRSGQKAS